MAELRIENLVKSYGKKTVVKDVSLVVNDKEFLVLLGPSGCGKTTLLRSIAGLEEIDSGNILINGEDVTGKSPKERRISMVFQSYAVFPHLSVGKNIAFGLERMKRPKDEVEERVRSAAELLHIEDLLDRNPNQLSGGQRQRVAVARAIAFDADLLLMDEPLSNLDALLRMEMRAELKRLVQEIGATVIYVTHDQTEALSMGDRVAVMGEGNIIQNDKPIEIYDNPASSFIAGFIGNPPMNQIPVTVGKEGKSVTIEGVGRFSSSPVGATDGDTYYLGVRAENFDLHSNATGGSIPASVLVVEPLGSHNLLTVDIGNNNLIKVQDDPDSKLEPGSKVWLEPKASKIRWIRR